MQKIISLLILSLFGLMASAAAYSVDDLPNVQKADHTKHLVNPDGIVSPLVQAQIDTLLLDGRRQSSAEIVAVIVDDIDADDIDTYATQLFNSWGIGKSYKNNGILLLVAKDRRKAVIRTGYGAEGVLPDIISGRILHDVMFPKFKDGDYEGGMLEGVKAIHKVVTNPEFAQELKSQEKDNYFREGSGSLLSSYFKIAAAIAVAALIFVLFIVVRKSAEKGVSDYEKYVTTAKYQLPLLLISLFFIGIPILAFAVLWLMRWYWRNHTHKCPNCGTRMNKLDEVSDNKYLNYAQDLEEQLKSVDYDVWLCPKCGEQDIYSFVNDKSNYKECEVCHARTKKLVGTRIIRDPSVRSEGIGEKQYVCLNCNHRSGERYTIPRKEPPVVIVGPGFGGGRGGGGGFGGGSFGGGFGGGLTGGGGASGGW